ncbi:Histone RNA hairpin-binding protein [Amphibalanus amphitrite]|uniref:Histone RNA hairpin-binding protein n=1 Tax=Amphibalanus amphitrite TaxID=1232801 RepID=A0A6A4VHR6_AMPAM|nr:Histone RNA hairpin-binding protein [Amphibalanus amphitrite]
MGIRRSPRKGSRPVRTPQFVVEDDPVILARRQKQIEYGKNTLAYQQYTAAVPRAQRLGYHPRTPVKRRVQSRRRWDNAVRCWRVHLHYWNDPAKLAELRGQESASDTSSVVSDPAETGPAPEAAGEHGAEAAAETGVAAEGSEAAQMGQGDPGAAAAEKEEGEEAFDWAAEVEEMAEIQLRQVWTDLMPPFPDPAALLNISDPDDRAATMLIKTLYVLFQGGAASAPPASAEECGPSSPDDLVPPSPGDVTYFNQPKRMILGDEQLVAGPARRYAASPVRRRADRQRLPGWSCAVCKEWYSDRNMTDEELRAHMNRCSRHRQQEPPPPDTPPEFWDPVAFPATDITQYGAVTPRPRPRRRL